MGALRERMAVDLRLRGLSPVTQRMYLRCAERFVAYYQRSPKALGESEIRAFLDHLVQEKRVSRSTHGVYVAAVHFLYRVTLDRPWVVRRIPSPPRERERLPEVLSQAEIERLLRAVRRPKHSQHSVRIPARSPAASGGVGRTGRNPWSPTRPAAPGAFLGPRRGT